MICSRQMLVLRPLKDNSLFMVGVVTRRVQGFEMPQLEFE